MQFIIEQYSNFAQYFWNNITFQNDGGFFKSYFWMLVLISAFFFILEIIKPWRKGQGVFRKDFWLDFFYMFFNFFLFSLIIYQVGSEAVVLFFNDLFLNLTRIDLTQSNPIYQWPLWAVLIFGFVVRDFIQWWTHRLLHRVSFLWNYHKVHHSVEEMGFAAHLRYHWMETLVYRSIEYLPLALLGINLYEFFIIHVFTIAWGHYNHSNITVDSKITGGIFGLALGVFLDTYAFDFSGWSTWAFIVGFGILGVLVFSRFMKYLFNSPEMHIWHHAYDMPADKPYGINFGLTLAIWDYIFGTARIPHDGRDIKLGFPGVEKFPKSFAGQVSPILPDTDETTKE